MRVKLFWGWDWDLEGLEREVNNFAKSVCATSVRVVSGDASKLVVAVVYDVIRDSQDAE